MYALLENRQRQRKRRWIIGILVGCILAVAVICIATKTRSSHYNKKYMKKYNNTNNKEGGNDKDGGYGKNGGNGKDGGKSKDGSYGKHDKYCKDGSSGDNILLKYFDKQDGADITWAHAVNCTKKLNYTLDNEEMMMLEADVILDPRDNSTPIIAHPSENSSDLTLEKFVKNVLERSKDMKMGMKLDFKETQALEPSVVLLENALKDEQDIPPIILNADIIKGPNTDENATTTVDADEFLKICGRFKRAILSPGWTTAYVGGNSTGYTANDTDAMVSLLKQSGVSQEINFPVRASLVALNPKQMHLLLGQNKSTLTIWTSSTDEYKPEDLAFLRLYRKRVFYDLPADQIKKIKAAGKKIKAASKKSKAAGEKSKAASKKSKAAGEKSKAAGEKSKAASKKSKAAGEKSKAAGEKSKAAGKKSKPASKKSKAAGKKNGYD